MYVAGHEDCVALLHELANRYPGVCPHARAGAAATSVAASGSYYAPAAPLALLGAPAPRSAAWPRRSNEKPSFDASLYARNASRVKARPKK